MVCLVTVQTGRVWVKVWVNKQQSCYFTFSLSQVRLVQSEFTSFNYNWPLIAHYSNISVSGDSRHTLSKCFWSTFKFSNWLSCHFFLPTVYHDCVWDITNDRGVYLQRLSMNLVHCEVCLVVNVIVLLCSETQWLVIFKYTRCPRKKVKARTFNSEK